MDFTFTLNVNVEHRNGKFTTREEIRDLLIVEMEAANPALFESANGGQYAVTSWDIDEA